MTIKILILAVGYKCNNREATLRYYDNKCNISKKCFKTSILEFLSYFENNQTDRKLNELLHNLYGRGKNAHVVAQFRSFLMISLEKPYVKFYSFGKKKKA